MEVKRNARIGATYKPIVHQLEVATIRMSSQDIGSWKKAIDSARSVINPNRKLLYELFDNIILDGHTGSVAERRRINITNKKLHYIAKSGGQGGDTTNDITIETPWFYTLIGHLQDAKTWGHSLIELIPKNGVIADAKLVPRANVRPETGMLMKNPYDYTNGWLYREDPYYSNYLIEAGGDKNYGKLMTAAQYVIYKRGGFGDWAQFAELFGMPFRVGKYNQYDDDARQKLSSALKEAGSAGYIIIPEGTSVEFPNPVKQGQSDIFKELIEVCNSEISKIFLGQTMTTDNGSSRSQSEVHERVEDAITLADMIEMEYMLNWEVKPKLQALGLRLPEGKFAYAETENLPLETRINVDVKLANEIEIPDEYWYDTYGIPKPEGGPAKSSKKPAKTEKEEEDDQKKKDEVIAHQAGCGHYHYPEITASVEYDITPEEEALLKSIYNSKTGTYDYSTYRQQVDKLAKGLRQGLQVNAGYNEPDYLAATLMEANINRFGFNKNVATVLELNRALDINESFNDFHKKARSILGVYNHAYLVTEYNLAIATGQEAADWNRQWAQRDVFPFWEYVTVGDDRVRPAHAALDGKIFALNDPSSYALAPPNGHGCRCTRKQLTELEVDRSKVIDGSAGKGLLGDEWDKMEKGGFAKNRAITKDVFDLNTEYIDRLTNGKRPDVNKLTYADAGLPSFDAIPKKYKSAKLNLKDTPLSEVWTDFNSKAADYGIAAKRVATYTDYTGRPVGLDNVRLMDQMGAKYMGDDEQRHLLYQKLGDILQNPSEVYMQPRNAGAVYTYLKYFAGRSVMVSVILDATGLMVIDSWQFVSGVDGLRVGILVNKGW